MAEKVLITGAAGNLGQAMVDIFLANGYQVIGIRNPGKASGRQTDQENLRWLEADLTDEMNTEKLLSEQVREEGSINVAVLTVGGFAMGNILETPLAAIQQQMVLNFNTAYAVARPLYRFMKENGKGRIFLVGSAPGLDLHKSKSMVAYGLSKSLLFRLAEILNEDAKGSDIITQVIVPSTIDTPQNRKALPDADFSKWVKPEYIAQRTMEAIGVPEQNRTLIF